MKETDMTDQTDDHHDDDRETTLENARGHMNLTAMGLLALLGPLDTAGVLMGAAQGVLVDNFGREAATRYLTELAAETAGDGDGGPAGHA